MAEKRERFIVIDEGLDFIVRDAVTGDELIDADGVADVLNDYEKENEQLKSEKEHYKKQVDELDGLLNKFEVTFEELEDILYMKRSRLDD